MTSDISNCACERQRRAAVVMAAVVTGAALLATMYGLSVMAGLIASWLTP